jgi:hypothetical protein
MENIYFQYFIFDAEPQMTLKREREALKRNEFYICFRLRLYPPRANVMFII